MARVIRGNANTVVENLQAFAEQRAEQIKGEANRRAAEYLREMSQDEAFAIFLVDLDTLRAGLKDTATLILSDESPPWHLLRQNAVGGGPIPQRPQRNAGDPTSIHHGDDPVSSPTARRRP